MRTSLFIIILVGEWLQSQAIPVHWHRWKRANILSFNDPQYSNQFYLNDNFGVTMNIKKAWEKGYNGKNITICINDPMGVYYQHDELSARFNMKGSYNFDTNKTEPSPEAGSTGSGAHGTMMAGLAAAQGNNGKCGVGVAFAAYITGVKTAIGQPHRDESKMTADSLTFANQINDIYSCSWGMINAMESNIGYLKPIEKMAVKNGAEKGRNGKGSIFVFANGNGALFNGTCSYDEYVSSIYTIGISVVTGKNVGSRQNVKCPGVSAVAYARDGSLGVSNPDDLMPTCDNGNQCTRTTSSSSAAAAVASGIFALVLQANPNLGWRDLQHLIARSSCSRFPTVIWKTNKAGIKVSDEFGFGLLDADALTENARTWKNSGKQLECKIEHNVKEKIHGIMTTTKSLSVTSWPSRCGGEAERINFLEHVQLVISFNFTKRKYIEIEIEAPTRTKSLMLRSGRRFDRLSDVNNLSILTLHHWGENPRGIWQMRVRNVKPSDQASGYLFKWGLIFYGTKDDPMASNSVRPSMISALNTTTNPPVRPGTSPTASGMWTTVNITTENSKNVITSASRIASTKFGSASINHTTSSTKLIILIIIISIVIIAVPIIIIALKKFNFLPTCQRCRSS